MKKQNIFVMLLAVAFTFALPNTIAAQQNSSEKIAKQKHDKKEQFKAHRAAIEAIQNDATLSETEKEALIMQKNAELRENVGRRGSAKGKGNKGKFGSNKAREEWKKNKEAISKEIETIENDDTLSDEEKELKKRTLLNEKLGEKRRNGKKGGAYKHMDKDERKAKKEEKKAQLEAIKNNPNLSSEEKAAKRKALFTKDKKTGLARGNGDMHHGKSMHKEMTKEEAQKKYGQSGKGDGFAKKEMSTRQKEKALAALKRNEARLAKDLKKGKISQERYETRLAKINQVKEKILKN